MNSVKPEQIVQLTQFVNLVLQKGKFDLTGQEAIEFTQLVIAVKDIKDTLISQSNKGN